MTKKKDGGNHGVSVFVGGAAAEATAYGLAGSAIATVTVPVQETVSLGLFDAISGALDETPSYCE